MRRNNKKNKKCMNSNTDIRNDETNPTKNHNTGTDNTA